MHNAADPGMAQAHIESRRTWLLESVARPLRPPLSGSGELSPDRREHLLREAEDLFWNELSWEELTDEEMVAGGHLTELVFPGFLALIDGLLAERSDHAGVPARRHADVVEEVLAFLGCRYTEFTTRLAQGVDSERVVWSRALTARLIDLVLFRLYQLTPAEREELERVE